MTGNKRTGDEVEALRDEVEQLRRRVNSLERTLDILAEETGVDL